MVGTETHDMNTDGERRGSERRKIRGFGWDEFKWMGAYSTRDRAEEFRIMRIYTSERHSSEVTSAFHAYIS